MNYSFEYIDIILLAMIAGFIFLRLRGILGKRTGFEGKVPSQFEKILNNTQTEKINSQNIADQKILGRIGVSNILTRFFVWFYGTVVAPLLSFFKKNTFKVAFAILGFIFLFKIGEAFLGRMSLLFYKEVGFSKTDIAFYSKGIGWLTTITFTLLGGLFAVRMGLVKAMFVSGVFMASTNILFSILGLSACPSK